MISFCYVGSGYAIYSLNKSELHSGILVTDRITLINAM